MTGVVGLPVMGPEAGTRLDRPGVPAGARRLLVDRGGATTARMAPLILSNQTRPAGIVRRGAFAFRVS